MKKILAFLPIFLSLNILPVKGETVLEEIQKTGVLKVGLREDAVPFAYRSDNNEWQGVCLVFIELLKQKILAELGTDVLSIRLYESTLFNRFLLVQENIIHLECGPNTIRSDLGNASITFSEPFFITGTQFLVKTAETGNINLDDPLAGLNLGVLKDSSTELFLRNKYPEANLVLFQGGNARSRGVRALRNGTIEAFFSDGILLLGEVILQGLAFPRDYQLLPENPLTCDYYGMIIPKNDLRWEQLVNEVISEVIDGDYNSAFSPWLGVVEPYLRKIEAYCQE